MYCYCRECFSLDVKLQVKINSSYSEKILGVIACYSATTVINYPKFSLRMEGVSVRDRWKVGHQQSAVFGL